MNKEIAKMVSNLPAVKDDNSMTREVGGALVKTGAAGGAIMLTAGILPFITFPMIIILMVVFGGALYLKG